MGYGGIIFFILFLYIMRFWLYYVKFYLTDEDKTVHKDLLEILEIEVPINILLCLLGSLATLKLIVGIDTRNPVPIRFWLLSSLIHKISLLRFFGRSFVFYIPTIIVLLFRNINII